MVYEVRKCAASNDPRGWGWSPRGWDQSAMMPYNWLITSPGAFDWLAPLDGGMVLHHSVNSVQDDRRWVWQVDTVFDKRTYQLQINTVANNEPTHTIPTIRIRFFMQQFFGGQLYQGELTFNTPYPIQEYYIANQEMIDPNPPGNCMPSNQIVITPVPWWTPETPGGD